MDITDIIRELKYVENKYKDKQVDTGEIRVGDMAYDCRVAIEELVSENEELKLRLNK